MFPAGKTLGLMDGFWYAGDFYTNDAAFDNWEVAGVPVGPSGSKEVSGYWPNWLVIPKGTDHAADMFKYFDYIAGEGVLTWYAVTPDLPASGRRRLDPGPDQPGRAPRPGVRRRHDGLLPQAARHRRPHVEFARPGLRQRPTHPRRRAHPEQGSPRRRRPGRSPMPPARPSSTRC